MNSTDEPGGGVCVAVAVAVVVGVGVSEAVSQLKDDSSVDVPFALIKRGEPPFDVRVSESRPFSNKRVSIRSSERSNG